MSAESLQPEIDMHSRTQRAVIVGLLLAAVAAAISTWLMERGWLAFLSWLIFFASLEVPLLLTLARAKRIDRCSAWLLGRPTLLQTSTRA